MADRPIPSLDATLVEGTVSEWILHLVQFLDQQLGAAEWGTRQVGLVTVVILGIIRFTCADAYGVIWYQFIHAIFSGYLSFLAVWLNFFAAESLTGTPEPLRSFLCYGPLTSLHRIVPAITMGFGLFDILDGMGHGLDFLLHGVGTFTVMAYFCEYGIGELILPMLLMEISSPHLNLMRFTAWSEKGLLINMGLFTLTFFGFRLGLCPYLWRDLLRMAFERSDDPLSQSCIPWHFKYFLLVFGIIFNGLNIFWAIKIVKKILRKVTGIEKVHANNEMKHR